jgi:glycosyltransferase involved in cell wall biosynthesis
MNPIPLSAENQEPIAIDLHWFRSGASGGIESLSLSFVDSLLRFYDKNRFILIIHADARYCLNLPSQSNTKIILTDGIAELLRKFLWEIFNRMPIISCPDHWSSLNKLILHRLEKENCKIIISIPGYINPIHYSKKNILIVPDIQHEFFPEYHSEDELEWRKLHYTSSINNADHIIAISDFTRDSIIKVLGTSSEKITTMHLGADQIYLEKNNLKKDREVLKKYGLTKEEYIFYPGNTWPHKNPSRSKRSSITACFFRR